MRSENCDNTHNYDDFYSVRNHIGDSQDNELWSDEYEMWIFPPFHLITDGYYESVVDRAVMYSPYVLAPLTSFAGILLQLNNMYEADNMLDPWFKYKLMDHLLHNNFRYTDIIRFICKRTFTSDSFDYMRHAVDKLKIGPNLDKLPETTHHKYPYDYCFDPEVSFSPMQNKEKSYYILEPSTKYDTYDEFKREVYG